MSNWLTKLCQIKDYLDIGHPGYGNIEDTKNVLLWWYSKGNIYVEKASEGDHNDVGCSHCDASGRIDINSEEGSITFTSDYPLTTYPDEQKHKQIIESLIARFPGINFYVFHSTGEVSTLQDYWEGISH